MNPQYPAPPQLTLTVTDIGNLLEQVRQYHHIYNPFFQRREQREKSETYLYGLLCPEIDNKTIEPMMLKLKGDDPNEIRAMQHFVSKGTWCDAEILTEHWGQVGQDLGDPDGVYLFDGSDFAKQGSHSVGVKRQHCGELGKIANCQAGVFAGYVGRKGYTVLDRRLYLPEEWVQDPAFAELRQECGIPTDVVFKTKPELALEILRAVRDSAVLPGRWVACDEAFGRSTTFLDQVAVMKLWYYAEIPLDTQVWLEKPATLVPEWSGQGRKPTQERLVEGTPPPQAVSTVAAALPDDSWRLEKIKEGSKGPLLAHIAILRVIAVRDGLPGPQVWLILRHNRASGELKAYLSNAPVETSRFTLIQMSGVRWPIETIFEEGKQLIGLGDYQVRSWTGWHHHMTMCILAHFFLIRLALRLKDKAPALTVPQTQLLLTGLLPRREFDARWVLEVLGYRQRRNYAAYLSHRKRRLAQFNLSTA